MNCRITDAGTSVQVYAVVPDAKERGQTVRQQVDGTLAQTDSGWTFTFANMITNGQHAFVAVATLGSAEAVLARARFSSSSTAPSFALSSLA